MLRDRVAISCAAVFTGVLAACTLTHSLDGYSQEYGVPEGDSGAADSGARETGSVNDAAPTDAGCVGNPVLLEPSDNETVGATMRVRVSAPGCIATMIVYIDSKQVFEVSASALDQSFPVDVGTHHVNVNGWANSAVSHPSPIVTVKRAQ